MKVLHVITDTNLGGAGRHILTLFKQPAFVGLDVSVACPGGELAKRLETAGVQTISISGKDVSFSGSLALELVRLLRRVKPDLVHTHSCLSGRVAARLLGIPVVYTKHGQTRTPSAWGRVSPPGLFKRRFNRLVAKLFCDRVIAVSQSVGQELVESGIEPSRVVCVLNGIELDQFRPRPFVRDELADDAGQVVVGTLARLHRVKALDVFVNASRIVLGSLPRARFVIGGMGPEQASLKSQIEKMKMEPYVKMAGFVEDVPGFLAGLDVYVQSSDSEGLGLALIEAMASGLPVVGTDVGGVPEIIEDEVTGFLVPPRNPRLLAQSVVRLAIDPDLAARMGASGRERAFRLFDAKTMAQKTKEVYEGILAGRGFRNRFAS